MKVLIACEESQVELHEFLLLGHNAWSCDLQPCSGSHPDRHLQIDVCKLLSYDSDWDLIIAHPPCTYLSNAGARWLYPDHILSPERYSLGLAALDFFYYFYNFSCSHIAIENPIPSRIYKLPKPDQIFQPFEFGEHFSKRTCLWLHCLPPLFPTLHVDDFTPYVSSSTQKGYSRVGGSSRSRSRSFVGVARAMASQLSYFLEG